MENIFYKIIIPTHYFNFNKQILNDLFDYLYDNLHEENKNTLSWDLENALTTNANGEYI
jgi:hypothetical protein